MHTHDGDAVHEHDHDHDHHGHDDHDRPLEHITHVHGGPPILDIGGDIGALVVLADWSRIGTELFVHREADGKQIHTGIWGRQHGDRQLAAAVFCELDEGVYSVTCTDSVMVMVHGGEVTEIDTRTSPAR
jgi:hypothetical protein